MHNSIHCVGNYFGPRMAKEKAGQRLKNHDGFSKNP
jgi:hypothetical protein